MLLRYFNLTSYSTPSKEIKKVRDLLLTICILQIFTDAGQYVIQFGKADSSIAPVGGVNQLMKMSMVSKLIVFILFSKPCFLLSNADPRVRCSSSTNPL